VNPVRLGQNFLADPNLLEAIVRESGAGAGDVVLEVGAGAGVLSRALAQRAGHLHAVELDRRLQPELSDLAEAGNVSVHWGDAMRLDLGDLRPAPTMVVANLPYSVATPVIIRTLEQLPGVESWTVLVQREIADRLRAAPGGREYGSPSVIVQLAADVKLLRAVDPAVFKPRPRVRSAVLGLTRTGPAPSEPLRRVVREAFAHRRKALPRSLELARPGMLEPARAALAELGLPEDARAETLSPPQFADLARILGRGTSDE
jgi:16S rRNA (adenine1518-N6/adenine1519-N6)-dimethyltransferase